MRNQHLLEQLYATAGDDWIVGNLEMQRRATNAPVLFMNFSNAISPLLRPAELAAGPVSER